MLNFTEDDYSRYSEGWVALAQQWAREAIVEDRKTADGLPRHVTAEYRRDADELEGLLNDGQVWLVVYKLKKAARGLETNLRTTERMTAAGNILYTLHYAFGHTDPDDYSYRADAARMALPLLATLRPLGEEEKLAVRLLEAHPEAQTIVARRPDHYTYRVEALSADGAELGSIEATREPREVSEEKAKELESLGMTRDSSGHWLPSNRHFQQHPEGG